MVKYLSVILKWRRLIFWNTLVLTLLAVAVSFILPQRFSAVAQILPPSDENDMFGLTSMLGGGGSAGRIGRLRLGMLGSSTASDLLVGILSSRTVLQRTAEICSITTYYRIRKPSSEKAVRQLRDMVDAAAKDDGIVRISAEAKDPRLAAKIANTLVAQADSFLRTSNISRGRNMRVFIERRLQSVALTLESARESLRLFQEANSVTAVDEETKAAVEAYAKLRSQLLLKETELGFYEGVAGADNPYVASLQGEVGAFRTRLLSMENGTVASGYGVGFGVSFKSLPAVAAEFARRYADFRIQEEAYAALYQQYEYARILEARDTPSISVLDPADPPERKSFPKRGLMVLAAALFGVVVGIALAFLMEYFETIKRVDPDTYEGWMALRSQAAELWRSKRAGRPRPRPSRD